MWASGQTYIDCNPTASMTKNLPRDRYPACHPSVLSCKQQTIALTTVHDVSNIHDHEDTNTVVLPVVAKAHPHP